MIIGVIWLVMLYGTGAIIVHVAHYRMLKANKSSQCHHYVINTKQSQLQIEWSIRSLLLGAWLKGEAVRITVIDHGSTDDTIAILRKLSNCQYPDTIQIFYA